MTMGTVVVACFAAWLPGKPWVTMTLTSTQLSGQLRQTLVMAFSPPVFDHNVLALDIQVAQVLPQRLELPRVARRRQRAEETDSVHFVRRVLGTGGAGAASMQLRR